MRRRVHLVAFDFLAQGFEADRVGNGDPRRLFLDDDLRLLVELGAVGLLGCLRGFDDQVFERLVAPARVVAAALDCFPTENRPQEALPAPLVTRPAAPPALTP